MTTNGISSLLCSTFHPNTALLPLFPHRSNFLMLPTSSPSPSKFAALKIKSQSKSRDHDFPSKHPPLPESPLLDRREVIAASVASGLSLLATPFSASGTPITTPNLNDCKLATVSPPVTGSAPNAQVFCCLPKTQLSAVDYEVDKNPPTKTRMAAHKIDAEYIAKYNKAYQLMKNLPPTDPRSFKVQADIHCAFCNGAYTQYGIKADLEVHFSWIFLPWHRWYLYFHERILGSLLGDPNFALAYWNWDDQQGDGKYMPQMFLPQNTALYNAKRNQAHLPPTIVNLNLGSTATKAEDIIEENLNEMYQTMVTSTTPKLFMGGDYRAGDSVSDTAGVPGTLESAPHNAVHAWVGDDRQTYGEDMGNLYSAARDPIFFAHHSNVDRLWYVWRQIGGDQRQKDVTDTDFLNATFLFYDEKGRPVRVRAGDAVESEKLGVFYEPAETDKLWLNYSPKPVSEGAAKVDDVEELGLASKAKGSKEIKKRLVSKVQRPSQEEKAKVGEAREEVLVLKGVEHPTSGLFQLAVFINLPDADEKTPTSIAEYVGSFNNIPHFGMQMEKRLTDIRLPISDNLKRVDLTDTSTIVVTIVVRGTKTDVPITITSLKIEYE